MKYLDQEIDNVLDYSLKFYYIHAPAMVTDIVLQAECYCCERWKVA